MKKTVKSGVQLTKEGREALQNELNELKKVKLPAVLERVAAARAEGDLSENSSYIFGKQEQEFIEGRIAELEDIISGATMVKATSGNGIVDIGCRVTVAAGSLKHVFTVVGDWEANPAEKKISGNSPLGMALIGKRVGEKAEVQAPAGKVVYTIVGIE